MIGNFTYLDLTSSSVAAILSPVAHVGGTGLASRNVAAQPQTCGFFVRKISVSHIMAGWAEHSQEWPGATPVRQLCSVRHPMIGVIRRRVYNLIRVAIMNTLHPQSAQNSEQTEPKTINDLHQAFAELCLSYGTLGRNISAERNNEALEEMIVDCEMLTNASLALRLQAKGGVK
ncbi:MAG: hypothetical protein QX198_17470 [Methylococcaceae bacterium]